MISLICDHEKNARRVIASGLDVILDIAENAYAPMKGSFKTNIYMKKKEIESFKCDEEYKKLLLLEEDLNDYNQIKILEQTEKLYMKNSSALATTILQLIGPYNYLICPNCQTKQGGDNVCLLTLELAVNCHQTQLANINGQ